MEHSIALEHIATYRLESVVYGKDRAIRIGAMGPDNHVFRSS